MSCQKIEDLKPSDLYELHLEKFSQLLPWLKEFFGHFTNEEKIINLLSYWLYINRSVFACYGSKGLEEFSKGRSNNPFRFSYQYEFGVDVNVELKPKKNSFLFKVGFFFLKRALLPGGNVGSLMSKIEWRLTKFVLNCAPLVADEERKLQLITKISDYFLDFGLDTQKLSLEIFLNRFLPVVFFSKPLETPLRKSIVVDCSASAFMEFCGYENILLCQSEVKVLGRQHGGGYDTFMEDYFIIFEKTLCNKFLGWGMSIENEHQYRYPRLKPIQNPEHLKKVIWVERARLTLLSLVIFPDIYRQWTNQNVINYIGQELKTTGINFFSLIYPGHLRSDDYQKVRGQELRGKKGRGETLLTSNDIVIFDNTSASLIHHCIENEITFILVVEREQLAAFTKAKMEWFELLRSERLAFFTDEVGLLSDRILEVLSDTFKLSKKITDYHTRTFVNIKNDKLALEL